MIGLILLIYIAICALLGMLISVVVKTEQQFQGIAMLISLPVMFLSGVFFPVEAMPKIHAVNSPISASNLRCPSIKKRNGKRLGN